MATIGHSEKRRSLPATDKRGPAAKRLGPIVLRMQEAVDKMANDPSIKSDRQAELVGQLQCDLKLAVSNLDALHRVDSARILPAILYNWERNYIPNSREVSRMRRSTLTSAPRLLPASHCADGRNHCAQGGRS